MKSPEKAGQDTAWMERDRPHALPSQGVPAWEWWRHSSRQSKQIHGSFLALGRSLAKTAAN